MAIGVNWAEIWDPVWKDVWTQTPPVEVPDVVGETQAAGTATLEGAGFVVAVETAYSESVAEGLIISQDPSGGTFTTPGSTVTITVSLGAESVEAGAGSRRRRVYLVQIDGNDFEVSSVAEAEALLQRAKALAEKHAPQVTERTVRRIKRGKRLKAPVISTPSPELESLVSEYRDDIQAIYEQIARDAEIRELLRLKLLQEDEDDAIAVLLLH